MRQVASRRAGPRRPEDAPGIGRPISIRQREASGTTGEAGADCYQAASDASTQPDGAV